MAKRRNKATKDFIQINQIKDGEGRVLSDEKEIKNRWQVYFEKLQNEESERRVFGEDIANERETPGIKRSEVRQALKKTKNAKATGPDGIPAEVWKSLGCLLYTSDAADE